MIILSKNYVFSHSSPFPFSHSVIKSDKKRNRGYDLLVLIIQYCILY